MSGELPVDRSETENQVIEIRELLASLLRFAEVNQRAVERALGMSSGSLSRLLSGGSELKVRHVIEICEALGFDPGLFWSAAYPPRLRDEVSMRLKRLLDQVHPQEREEPSVADDLAEIRQRLDRLETSAALDGAGVAEALASLLRGARR